VVPLSVPSSGPGWSFSLYPAAAEGGGCFVGSHQPERSTGTRGAAADPERAAAEAARRARATVRRYCAANGLNRLGTLTYGPPRCTDPAALRAHVAGFFRDLRDALGGDPLPYVWVPELHKDGVHFHVHFAVGRFVPAGLIRRTWGRGYVSIKLLGDLGVGAGALEEARRAAGYLSKYVAKSFDDDGDGVLRPKGLHRFDVGQGFTPRTMVIRGATRAEVIEHASGAMGGPPDRFWSSSEVEDWQGPPAVWVQWKG